MTQDNQTLTITLTGRRPVKINKPEWRPAGWRWVETDAQATAEQAAAEAEYFRHIMRVVWARWANHPAAQVPTRAQIEDAARTRAALENAK